MNMTMCSDRPLRERRTKRWSAGLLVAGLVLFPAIVRAHNKLISSVPQKDGTLTVAPRELRLTFAEALELAISSVTLTGPDGAKLSLGMLAPAVQSRVTLVASVPGGLSNGKYTVHWRVTGKDGHAVRGTFQFTLAVAAPLKRSLDDDAPAAAPFDASSTPYAAARGIRYAGLLTIIGAAAFVLGVLPRIRAAAGVDVAVLRTTAMQRARTVALAGVLTLLSSCALRLAAQVVAVGDASSLRDSSFVWSVMLQTSWGHAWLLEVGAALLALWAVGVRPRAVRWGGVALAVPVLGVAAALSGHAAALPGRAPLAVALDATHVLSASGWMGGLLSVLAAGVPAARALGRDASDLAIRAVIIAFSPTALVCAGLLAASGAALAWLQLGALNSLLNTGYGRTLLVKLGVVALVAATGAYNWKRVLPTLGSTDGSVRLRRSATMELIIATIVIAITAVLVATPTPLDSGV